MSDKSLVDIYMAGGNVAPILSKMVQEGIDPKTLTETIKALDSAKALKEDQKSITEGEVIAVKTYGTIDQMKANFAKKYVENGDNDTIKPLTEQQVKLYCMMNANKELPLKAHSEENAARSAQKSMNPLLAKKLSERAQNN